MLLASFALASCGDPAAYRPVRSQPDNSQIIRAALAEIGGETGYGRPVCVGNLIDAEEANLFRDTLKELEPELGPAEIERILQDGSGWWGPDTGSNERPALKELPEKLGRELQSASYKIYSQPKATAPVRVRIPDRLAEGLAVDLYDPRDLEGADCQTRVHLGYPEVSGDIALVNEAMNCGPLCGSYAILAFRREEGEWRYVARSIYSIA